MSPSVTPNIENAVAPVIYNLNNNSTSNLNHDLQVWHSRSVSPLSDVQTPNVSEPRSYTDTVIKVTDDGWRMVTQEPTLPPHFGMAQATASPASLIHDSAAGASRLWLWIEKPAAALAPQWFSQPPPNVNFAAFQHPPPLSGEFPIYTPFPPPGPLSGPHEFYQAPTFFGMPMENKFQGAVPVPLHIQTMRPPAFPAVPGYCNINYSGGYQINYSKPPLDPFTDHSFGFEQNHHVITPQFPSQISIPSPPNFIFSNSVPMSGYLDSRMVPLVPIDFTPHPPQYLFPSPPQIQIPPSNELPTGSFHDVNVIGNNVVSEDCVEPPHANEYSSGLSPRHSRHSRNLQIRQPRTPSSSSSRSGNRNGRRCNQVPLPLSARSSVMEEFRCPNKDKVWTLKDIFGHIVEFCVDQNGSRLIQQQLEEASEEDKLRVFDEIVPSSTSQLIQDVFGNYVIQKFFDLGSALQKDTICLDVELNVINYSVHIYACRVVQKAFDHMSEEQQVRVIDRLSGNLLTCIKDQHGNHVIQKLIDTVSPERLTFLRIISANILDLAASSTGCRVLQRCLSKLPKSHLKPVLDAIDRHCDHLMRDQYGNYVIQFMLEHGDDDDKAKILAKVRGSVVKLAKNQYASHVCEQAITNSEPQNRSLLIGEILTNTEDGHPIPIMMQDDFANYVLQRALAMSEGQQRVVLFHQTKSFLMSLRRSTYSKQLVKIERLVDRYFGKMDKTPFGE